MYFLYKIFIPGCFEGPDPCFACAATDGTVSISHCLSNGSWGIVEDDNQILLHQKCAGIGAIDYGSMVYWQSISNSTLTVARRYIACCLRGGTIYLVPVIEHNHHRFQDTTFVHEKSRNDITMFALPVDPTGEDDGVVRYVQNFASGIAQVMHWKEETCTAGSILWGNVSDFSLKSVAMVGWPGGHIDVYEVFPSAMIDDDVILEQLVDRGIVTKLVERILSIDKSHSLLSSDSWRRAWEECNKIKNLDTILKGINDLSNDDFAGVRLLVRSLIK